MDTKKVGSGATTREFISSVHAHATASFRKELEAMKKSKDRPMGFSAKQIEDMCAGFADGMRIMRQHLEAAKIVTTYETGAELEAALKAEGARGVQ